MRICREADVDLPDGPLPDDELVPAAIEVLSGMFAETGGFVPLEERVARVIELARRGYVRGTGPCPYRDAPRQGEEERRERSQHEMAPFTREAVTWNEWTCAHCGEPHRRNVVGYAMPRDY